MLTSSITSSRPSDQIQLNIPPGKDHKHTYNTTYKPSFKLYQGFDNIANKTEVASLIDIFMFVIASIIFIILIHDRDCRSLSFHHLSSFFAICNIFPSSIIFLSSIVLLSFFIFSIIFFIDSINANNTHCRINLTFQR